MTQYWYNKGQTEHRTRTSPWHLWVTRLVDDFTLSDLFIFVVTTTATTTTSTSNTSLVFLLLLLIIIIAALDSGTKREYFIQPPKQPNETMLITKLLTGKVADGDCNHEIKTLAPWKKSYDQPRQHIKKQRHYFANKGPSSQNYGFSGGHV